MSKNEKTAPKTLSNALYIARERSERSQKAERGVEARDSGVYSTKGVIMKFRRIPIAPSLSLALLLTVAVVAGTFSTLVVFGQEKDLSRSLKVVPTDKLSSTSVTEWRAFLVSVKDYRHGINSLEFTDNDVEDIRRSLITLGVKPDNIVVMRKSDPDFNMVPTKENIEEQFQLFVDSLTENSVAFCYLSGHGFNVDRPGSTTPMSYFAPIDARLKATITDQVASRRGMEYVSGAAEDKDDESESGSSDRPATVRRELSQVESLRFTSVSINDMLEKLSNSRAKFKWLNVDACCTYLTSRAVTGSKYLQMDAIPSGVLFFQSCADGQASYEGADKRIVQVREPESGALKDVKLEHGLFTKSLIEAFNIDVVRQDAGTIVRNHADVAKRTYADQNEDGVVTLREIVEYVSNGVEADAKQYHNAIQTPQFRVNSESGLDDFALFTNQPVNGYAYEVWQKGRKTLDEAQRLMEFGDIPSAYRKIQETPEELKQVEPYRSTREEIQARHNLFIANQHYVKAQTEYENDNLAAARAGLEEAFAVAPVDADLASFTRLADQIDAKLLENWAAKLRNKAVDDFESAQSNLERNRYQNAIEDVNGALARDVAIAKYTKAPREEKYQRLRNEIIGAANQAGVNLEDNLPEIAEPELVARNGNDRSDGVIIDSPPRTPHTPGELRIIKINKLEIRFRYCPAGKYAMGSPESEAGHGADETMREVTIARGFWLAETETTQALWKSVMGVNPSARKASNLPVENVSWEDCQQFVAELNKSAKGLTFKLPTEAHWEYACRAGTVTRYAFGNSWDDEKANNFKIGGSTKSVGSYQFANPWGLKDMHGNVAELCQDWYGVYAKGKATEPTGPAKGDYRVARGGHWTSKEDQCRSASRDKVSASTKLPMLGFRLELEAND